MTDMFHSTTISNKATDQRGYFCGGVYQSLKPSVSG